jgi:hypothetical protein
MRIGARRHGHSGCGCGFQRCGVQVCVFGWRNYSADGIALQWYMVLRCGSRAVNGDVIGPFPLCKIVY